MLGSSDCGGVAVTWLRDSWFLLRVQPTPRMLQALRLPSLIRRRRDVSPEPHLDLVYAC